MRHLAPPFPSSDVEDNAMENLAAVTKTMKSETYDNKQHQIGTQDWNSSDQNMMPEIINPRLLVLTRLAHWIWR